MYFYLVYCLPLKCPPECVMRTAASQPPERFLAHTGPTLPICPSQPHGPPAAAQAAPCAKSCPACSLPGPLVHHPIQTCVPPIPGGQISFKSCSSFVRKGRETPYHTWRLELSQSSLQCWWTEWSIKQKRLWPCARNHLAELKRKPQTQKII